MSEYGQRLIASLKEAVAYKNGDKTKGRSFYYYSYAPEEIAEIRKKYNLTQKRLAEVLDVSSRTVEAWETGVNSPSGPATRLLNLLEVDTENIIMEMVQEQIRKREMRSNEMFQELICNLDLSR